ncbi:MAG: carbohydrate-binding domain-containing protein [Muribaculaceae bacterium]|nr:carbohydrate-binding domain-containing protein [Muribaculaceae bacterium]
MKKFISLMLATISIIALAQEKMFINNNDNISSAVNIEEVDDVSLSNDQTILNINNGTSSTSFAISNINDITFGEADDVVDIVFNGSDATVINPFACNGVAIEKNGAHITVRSTTENEIEYRLSGTTSDGSFKIYTDKKYKLTLNGANITNPSGAAINCQGSKKTSVNLVAATSSSLCDGSKYTTVEGEDMKGTFFSEGKIEFSGEGSLYVTALKKHAIVCDDEIAVLDGNIYIQSAASDAFHSNDAFTMSGGYIYASPSGDGIDGDEGVINISGGNIELVINEATTKGIKSDGDITISGGEIKINAAGGVVVTDGDPSYCTAIKGKALVNINGGTINITSTGESGKGISADGDINISSGNITISTSGNGAKYTTAENVVDSYSATCITGDANINIIGGSLNLSSAGTAGKGISADVDIVIGNDDSAPDITVKTTGAKFIVSGSGNNADYANPKAIKADNNLTIYNGNISVSTTKDGGEGIESKNIMTINGGNIEAVTYDDAINAKNNITINGGNIYCYSSGNDGMDSNGTITINGGVVISSGTSSPEEGFDCDQNTFKITGGIIIGTGGATSTPTASACTQRSLVYSASATSGNLIHIKDASGNDVLTYKLPRSYSQCTLLFSSPALSSGSSYTIMTGGTVSGGSEFHGYTTGGTYSGGTQATTFTSSAIVTTVGSSGGGGGGRPW